MIHAFIKKGCFQDSVSLMIISRKLSESENVDDVSVMMGTPANKALLDTTGFWHDDFNNATPLAFANVMPEGNIGVIGASGTGIQELCSQIALAGGGNYSRDWPWRARPQP